jgi:DNA-binding NtrC family response regulator
MIKINRFRRILLVDDKEVNRQKYTSIILKSLNPAQKTPIAPLIAWAQNAEEALRFLKDAREEGHPFNLLVTDLYMAPFDGIWLIKQLRSNDFSPDELDVILVSTEDAAMDSIGEIESVTSDWIDDSGRELKRVLRPEINEGAGTDDHDVKFLEAIWDGVWMRMDERLAESKRIVSSPTVGSTWQEKFITGDKRLIELINYTIKTLKNDKYMTVLITGDSGSGKGKLANMLHDESDKDGDFERIDLGLLGGSPEIIGSALFGHEIGAFTGAVKQKIGPIEKQNDKDATIFLDEIAEVPIEKQSMLLSLIAEKKTRREGGSRWISINRVQFIAATNKNIEAEIHKGKFRDDLYYRLNSFPIHIPPLNERKADIPLLIRHFWGIEPFPRNEKIGEDAINYLAAKNWGGSVLNLENYIKAIKAAHPEGALSVEVLKKHDKIIARTDTGCYIPPELNTLNKRVSHVIFHDILANCAAKNDAKSPVKKELCFKVAEIYGHWFHNDTEKVRKKIRTKFDQHIRPDGDNCSVCKAIWNSLK